MELIEVFKKITLEQIANGEMSPECEVCDDPSKWYHPYSGIALCTDCALQWIELHGENLK